MSPEGLLASAMVSQAVIGGIAVAAALLSRVPLRERLRLRQPNLSAVGWVLILPDAGEPLVHIFADSEDRDWVDDTLRDYRNRVQDFVEREQGIEAARTSME